VHQPVPRGRSIAAGGACLLLVVACGGCAPVPVANESGQSGLPPTVTLPLAMAGIADSRAPFAALFSQELNLRGSPAARPVGAWLHGVAAPSGNDGEWLVALNSLFAARAASTSVLIIPGIFDDCFDTQSVPFGDGVVRTRERSATEAYAQYGALGLKGIRVIQLPGRVSSAANGRRVADAIRSEAARAGVERVVLIAYSKGVPDTLEALAQMQSNGGMPAAVTALVSVAGVVMGTPFAEQFERLFETISPLVQPLDCSASDGHELASLTRRERVAWLAANPPPASLRYYSIVAHAPSHEIGIALRPFHASLSSSDPRNDGQVLASEAILPGSALLAEARADHWDVALPRDRHPNPLMRSVTSGRGYPREALFSAVVKWVVGKDR